MTPFEHWICRQYKLLRLIIFLISCVAVPLWLGATVWTAVSILVGLAITIWFVRRYQPRHFEPAWQQVAHRLGLRFVPPSDGQPACIEGEMNGRFLTLTPHNALPSWHHPSQTVLTVEIHNGCCELHFFNPTRHRRSSQSPLEGRTGVGHPQLDALFVFSHAQSADFSSLFTDELAEQLGRIGSSPTPQRITLTPQQLTYQANGILLNVNSLIFIIELMLRVAERAETAVLPSSSPKV